MHIQAKKKKKKSHDDTKKQQQQKQQNNHNNDKSRQFLGTRTCSNWTKSYTIAKSIELKMTNLLVYKNESHWS